MLNGSVLVVENDQEVTALVIETLTDAGLVVSTVLDVQLAAIQATSLAWGLTWCG
jgi:DNA-binding response OmpR family regulator